MSRPLRPRKFNETHIFVKSIPQHMARITVPRLFDEYKPVSEQNTFPHDKITTMVFGFRNKDDARRAQEAIDNRRLEGVVLRVELYRENNSVRYLRETAAQTRSRMVGFLDDNFNPSEWGGGKAAGETSLAADADVEEPKGSEELASPQLPDAGPQYCTWARIVANVQVEPPAIAPDLSHGGGRDTPTTIDDTPTVTPHITPAVPNLKPVTDALAETGDESTTELAKEAAQPEAVVSIAPEAETASSPGRDLTSESDITFTLPSRTAPNNAPRRELTKGKDERQGEMLTGASNSQNSNPNTRVATGPTSSYAPRPFNEWDHTDLSERIRRRHQCICSFCQLRNRLSR